MAVMQRIPPTLDPNAPRARRAALPPAQARKPSRKRPRDRDDELSFWQRYWRRGLAGLLVLGLMLTIVPVLVLRVVPAWTSSFMVGYQVDRLTDSELPELRHVWVPWDEIAPSAKLAVIAAEDQRFADHFGLDLAAIQRAREHNRRGRTLRGASTISQQVAKNLFLWSGRSWLRKGMEVGYTLLIELFWPKQRVLEVYLNIAEFGEGVYGVEAAAQQYFGRPAAQLTEYQAALLAAVLPSPKRMSVVAPTAYVQSRAQWIQGQMRQLGTALLDGL